jgi:hypothetical protein
MNDRILEFSERELVRQIIEHAVDFKFNAVESNCRTGHERELLRQVVKQAEASGADVIKSIRDAGCYLPFLEVPVIGLKYFPDDSDTSEVRQRVVRALARAWEFYQEGHGVLLPLRPENCQIMQNADDIELNLVGMFGSSLYDGGWDDRHPTFAPFVSGVMACELTPDEIRNDPKLQEGFPPQRLEGLPTKHWLGGVPRCGPRTGRTRKILRLGRPSGSTGVRPTTRPSGGPSLVHLTEFHLKPFLKT